MIYVEYELVGYCRNKTNECVLFQDLEDIKKAKQRVYNKLANLRKNKKIGSLYAGIKIENFKFKKIETNFKNNIKKVWIFKRFFVSL